MERYNGGVFPGCKQESHSCFVMSSWSTSAVLSIIFLYSGMTICDGFFLVVETWLKLYINSRETSAKHTMTGSNIFLLVNMFKETERREQKELGLALNHKNRISTQFHFINWVSNRNTHKLT